jgi:hypothetical protein
VLLFTISVPYTILSSVEVACVEYLSNVICVLNPTAHHSKVKMIIKMQPKAGQYVCFSPGGNGYTYYLVCGTKGQGRKARQIEYIWSCKFWIKQIQLGKANKHINQDEHKTIRINLALSLTLILTLNAPDFFNLQVQVTRDKGKGRVLG